VCSDIDCKYFDYGNGTCPFGTSCFYKHMFRDGSREEVKLRHLGAADGNTVIAKNVRLSDFLDRLDIAR
jgi:E3 ubiquitin-protein ligase makorin